jgi:hypothetical protein
MKFFALMLFLVSPLALASFDDYNTKVGFAQGGEILFVKEGGQVVFDGADVKIGEKQAALVVSEVSDDSAVKAAAPFPGTVSSIVYRLTGNTGVATNMCAKINGVLITGGCVAVGASAGAVALTATPSAANAVLAGSVLEVTADAGASKPDVGVVFTIKP